IRKLPGGHREFDLEERELTFIHVSHQTVFVFGKAQLQIESPFILRDGVETHRLDPEDRAALGPVLALYPGSAASLLMSPDGTLEVRFASGAILTVPPDPQFEAWNICGFWCPPGGFTNT